MRLVLSGYCTTHRLALGNYSNLVENAISIRTFRQTTMAKHYALHLYFKGTFS